MKDIEPTLDARSDIARARGTNIGSIALNYNIIKGAVPTVGAAAVGWRLSDEEVRKIDSVSLEGKATALWQQG